MDRTIVYPGSIPLDTDLLNTNRDAMVALGALISAVLGTGTVVDGLAVRPTAPATMQVSVGPGSIVQLGTPDATAYGSLAADAASPLMRMGVNLAATGFTLTAPANAGEAVAWMVMASFQEADTDSTVLPYYNAANPTQPFLGPANSGAAQPRRRVQRVQLQCRPGAAAPLGSQNPPAVDSGWVGLAVVTTTYGMTQIGAGNIAAWAASPIIPYRLPQLRPGFSQIATYAAAGSFVVPAGVGRVRIRALGGGGGGGAASNGGQSGGGSGGGYAEGVFAVTPGAVLVISVGAGGAGGSGGAPGSIGGTSAVAGLISATGGSGGLPGVAAPSGAAGVGGTGAGGSINLVGQNGSGGQPTTLGGAGGGSAMAQGGQGGSQNGAGSAGMAPGGGGGGTAAAVGANQPGGAGGAGLVIIEY